MTMDWSNTPIIFLDIDEVLLPFHTERHASVNAMELQKEIAEKYRDDEYLYMNPYDILKVLYAWEPESVELLKALIAETGAKIVLSTTWKENRPYADMLRLFKLHGLDEYIIGQTRKVVHDYKTGSHVFAYADYESWMVVRRLEEYNRFNDEYESWEDYVKEVWDELERKHIPYQGIHHLGKALTEWKPQYEHYSHEFLNNLIKESVSRDGIPHSDPNHNYYRRAQYRSVEILIYVWEHNIKNYVAIDDLDLSKELGRRSIIVKSEDRYFKKKHMDEVLCVLKEFK